MSVVRKITINYMREGMPTNGASAYIDHTDEYYNEGEYILITNPDIEADQETAAFLYEMLRIYHRDHENKAAADEIEALRHEELKRILSMLEAEEDCLPFV